MKTYEPKKFRVELKQEKEKKIISEDKTGKKMNQEHTKEKKTNTTGQENKCLTKTVKCKWI